MVGPHQRWIVAVFGSIVALALGLFVFASFLHFEERPSQFDGYTVVPANACSFIISGRVAHAGSGVAGAKVEVRRIRRSPEAYGSTTTNSDGSFTYVETDEKACETINRFVHVDPPGRAYYDYEHPALVRNGDQVEVELRSAMITLH
jgi:hypothetical protein